MVRPPAPSSPSTYYCIRVVVIIVGVVVVAAWYDLLPRIKIYSVADHVDGISQYRSQLVPITREKGGC